MSLRLPVQVFLDQVEAAGPERLEDRSIDDARAVFETFHSLGDAPEPVEHVSDTAIGPVPVRVYRPLRVSGPVVLWVHGGGLIVGSLESARLVVFDTKASARRLDTWAAEVEAK